MDLIQLPPDLSGPALWLPLVWAGIIALAVAMYVLLDGLDLGIGIMFTAAESENWRDRMMLSVAPVWDFNETWLILGGAGLFAVFHIAYAVLMPALYVPILVMLIALIFRGVAFEFRFKAERSKHWWDRSFHYGSLVATFAQGMVLGAFVQGFATNGRQFTGTTWDFLSPFSVMTGLALIAGYGLLGSTWLIMKTSGNLELWARRMAMRYLLATLAAMAVVSLWVPFLDTDIRQRWFDRPNLYYLLPVPLVTAVVALALWRAVHRNARYWAFLLAVALFLLGYLGLGISLFPNIVPHQVTIWEAANTPSSQMFTLIGFSFALPATLAYTVYAYWVFRGQVAEDVESSGYH
ncbi:cytochrome d ubiquinol oxidase subunit II [Rubellimicrobium arenae]|uniref:cytochrome d ubiquinol oxidase subunit II n=1 Tax=Rubellimicrobium arenae TaxID=2817372 RepID=UPI001B3152F3|nr:cytochrome d ubiquinol oxidase subunit II [Rubellimicrobium arenae]